MIEKLEKYKKGYGLITFFIGLLFGLISILWAVFIKYQGFLDKYEELIKTNQTTQQMALKSVIWNEEIPEIERISACDIYLNSGYNSATKKHCETIIKESEF